MFECKAFFPWCQSTRCQDRVERKNIGVHIHRHTIAFWNSITGSSTLLIKKFTQHEEVGPDEQCKTSE